MQNGHCYDESDYKQPNVARNFHRYQLSLDLIMSSSNEMYKEDKQTVQLCLR